MADEGILERIITADKTDIYGNRERIHAILGLTILYIKDEFAEPTLVGEAEQDGVERETD